MIKAQLSFVPPGGGEQDYALDFELPAVPRPGDYIQVRRPSTAGPCSFIVRRTWWHLDHPDTPVATIGERHVAGTLRQLVVECEFARGPNDAKTHQQCCDMYRNRGKPPKDLDESTY